MPACSVKVCKNRSSDHNFKSSGITYHRFPHAAELKEKWIDATGRPDNWFPTKSSTICSTHFEDNNFQCTKSSRRLFPWAIPTLNLRVTLVNHDVTAPSTSTKEKYILPTTNQPGNAFEVCEDIEDTPKIKLLKRIIERKNNTIKLYKLKIKSLQTTTRRYKKKCNLMKTILLDLKQKGLLNIDKDRQTEKTETVANEVNK